MHCGLAAPMTAGEQRALERIRDEGTVRLEQERIPWEVALDRLTESTAVA